MIKKDIVLENEPGLHARPASLFVKEAARYKADVSIIKDGREFNAKSIMGILSMGAGKGEKITIVTEGEDEGEAMEGLIDLLASNFGE